MVSLMMFVDLRRLQHPWVKRCNRDRPVLQHGQSSVLDSVDQHLGLHSLATEYSYRNRNAILESQNGIILQRLLY